MKAAATYTGTAVLLHWLMAALIVGTFCIGLYMQGLPLSPAKLKIYSWHKWAGVTVFLLLVVRLAWRWGHPAPAPVPGMPAWQEQAARAVHLLLYGLMLAVPLTGWLMSSAKGFQTVYFGVLPLPDLLAKDAELGDRLKVLHMSLTFVLAGLVLMHVAAALKHHLVDRDGTLARMVPALERHRLKETS